MYGILIINFYLYQLHPILDLTCILLPPRSLNCPPPNLMTNICAAFATRGNVKIDKVRKIIQDSTIEEWGRVRRVDSEEGDTMRSASLAVNRDDTRDATFVRVRL